MLADACPTPRKDGSPCQAQPTKSGYCLAHDASLAEKRQAARERGGFGKSRAARAAKLLPRDLEIMDDVLSSAISAVYRGSMSPSQGSAIAALAGARVRLREIALRLAEQVELADRISRLEEHIHEMGFTSGTNRKASGRLR
jgi:hypothetical protein